MPSFEEYVAAANNNPEQYSAYLKSADKLASWLRQKQLQIALGEPREATSKAEQNKYLTYFSILSLKEKQ